MMESSYFCVRIPHFTHLSGFVFLFPPAVVLWSLNGNAAYCISGRPIPIRQVSVTVDPEFATE